MANKPDPRFQPPNPRLAAKRRNALGAFLGESGFGVRVVPQGPQPSAMERARAAYAQEPEPIDLNWLSQLKPRDAQNFLINMVKGAASNPMAGAMPKMSLSKVKQLQAYLRARATFDAERMQGVNRFMAQQRTPFATGLEPPPLRSTPVKQYKYYREGFGPRVEVVDEIVGPPERITLEQAHAAGVTGPEAMPLPPQRFTRKGPRVEIHD